MPETQPFTTPGVPTFRHARSQCSGTRQRLCLRLPGGCPLGGRRHKAWRLPLQTKTDKRAIARIHDTLRRHRSPLNLIRLHFSTSVRDQYQRPLRDLRISVTDRCNFRCPYCMPKEIFGAGYPFLRDPQLMTLTELTRIAQAFVHLGVEKIRLTGGEPLLRQDLADLVRALKAKAGIPDVALTTNGWLLEKMAPALRSAGLDRLNVSVDSLDPVTAGRLNGQGFDVERVIRGIDVAAALGFPIKINCVVQRGINDEEIPELCRVFSRPRPHTSLYRIHGRGGTPTIGRRSGLCRGAGNRRPDQRALAAPNRWARPTAARWRRAIAIAMARAKSG